MISIITPVYNGERFIENCIKVVIEQNCPDREHIIIDGGSTDETVEIIKQYAENYPHIRWISEKDRGQSDAMNKGIAMAKGDILAILNVDDFYEPNVLNRVLNIFKDLPEPTLLVGNCNIRDDNDRITKVNKPSRLKLEDLLVGSTKNPFPANPSAYFYHTSLHKIIGLYKVDEHYAMDLDFILKAVKYANVKYVDETWGNFRLIKGTKTFNNILTGQNRESKKLIYELYRKEFPLIKRFILATKYYYFNYLDSIDRYQNMIKRKVKAILTRANLYSKI